MGIPLDGRILRATGKSALESVWRFLAGRESGEGDTRPSLYSRLFSAPSISG
jgi:hypothetical protein